MKLPCEIWIISDGTAGNLNPPLGLAEALHQRIPCNIMRRDVEIKKSMSFLPPQILLHTHFVSIFALQPLYNSTLLYPHEKLPDLVIGNGRAAIAVNAALKRYAKRLGHQMLSVQLQNPCVSTKFFDMVVTPSHDQLHGENVVEAIGSLNRISPESLKSIKVPDEFLSLPRPRIVVLIGGKSRHYMMSFPSAERMVRDVEALRNNIGGSLLITASRRTEPENLHFLRTSFLGRNIYFWNGEDDNPYQSFLACADLAIVTEDSVNMISEAASAGLKVLIYPLEGKSEKISRFHESMINEGYAEHFSRNPVLGEVPRFNETSRIADIIVKKITKLKKGTE